MKIENDSAISDVETIELADAPNWVARELSESACVHVRNGIKSLVDQHFRAASDPHGHEVHPARKIFREIGRSPDGATE